jgi:hypothetical protein
MSDAQRRTDSIQAELDAYAANAKTCVVCSGFLLDSATAEDPTSVRNVRTALERLDEKLRLQVRLSDEADATLFRAARELWGGHRVRVAGRTYATAHEAGYGIGRTVMIELLGGNAVGYLLPEYRDEKLEFSNVEDGRWPFVAEKLKEVPPFDAADIEIQIAHEHDRAIEVLRSVETERGTEQRSAERGDDLTGEEKALALLVAHPEWTDAKIAEKAGVSRTTLYKPNWTRYQAAREALRRGRGSLPRGTKDGETGDIEAWDDSG